MQYSVVQVATDKNHTAVLTKDGEVFTFGDGHGGRLGHGGEQNELLPRSVVTLSGKHVVHMAAGYLHTAVLTNQF